MRMYDLITKKKRGEPLATSEIRAMVEGFTKGEIPDYQMAAMLMAICFRSMTEEEMRGLTLAMAASGDEVDLSAFGSSTVDKHSTGGVGDKTTLIACPVVAAAGGRIAKMSGRGLGHTGGTVDKLESIPGFRTTLSREEFFAVVEKTGISLIGQSGELAPADKKLYALRDVTATVDSIPLIAASVMSKKLAAGSAAIVLDVKTGSGAFMKTLDDALALARAMVAIGEGAGRKTSAVITDMDVPLGFAVGNALEVAEAMEVLQGRGPADLREVSLALAADMLRLIGRGGFDECQRLAEKAVEDGSAFRAFAAMVEAQGGDASCLADPRKLPQAAFRLKVRAERSGYITHMDAETIGRTACMLGAGRETKESVIDHAAGIRILKKTGEAVEAGEAIAELHANAENLLAPAASRCLAAIEVGTAPPAKRPRIFARVTKESFRHAEAAHEEAAKDVMSDTLLAEIRVAMTRREEEGGADGR
ncbi:thymidine phosphorylase [uncultured Selenomonas sp.]|uniref:thymidine phosphorylase n=1 Tax=uncultured Selenomonas sp. TaxID=159275 RepID=UPI002613F1AA|nr:thymidine phosphorylase [uncultured Selenomonas sp.]